jgi:hypothetical protein
MSDREQQSHPSSPRTGPEPLPDETVTADVVSARRDRPHGPATAMRLQHGLLRRPFDADAPLRW